jgi:hypothetical protein
VLRITETQREILSLAARGAFEHRVLLHLERFFPAHCAALGPEATRRAISRGVDRAASYRIVGQRDVCNFIDVMFLFGEDFDRVHLWAASALTAHDTTPTGRVERLHAAALRQIHIAAAASVAG